MTPALGHYSEQRRRAAAELADDDDTEPFSGKPLRNKAEADPRAAAPALDLADLHKLCGRGHVLTMGTGDLRTPVDRPGAGQAAAFPSRRGDRLLYADGRVTDLNGNCITAPEVPRCSLPDSVHQTERIRRIVDARLGLPGRDR